MSFSEFQFSQPILTRAKFEMLGPDKDQGLKVAINLQRNVLNITGEKKALVDLCVQLNKKGDVIRPEAPFYSEVSMQSMFSWSDDTDEDQLKSLLELTAPTLLLSYIRPIVASLTNSAPINTYNIPFINLIELNKTMTESTAKTPLVP